MPRQAGRAASGAVPKRVTTPATKAASDTLPEPRSIDFDELPTYLGYLIRRAHSRIQAEFETSLAGIGIATSAFGILTLIRANPGLTAMDLVAASGLDKSTLSPVISGLEKQGLIRREARASDRRYQSLYFNENAEPDFAAFRDRIREFETAVENRLDESERSELARLLMKLQGLGEISLAPAPDTSKNTVKPSSPDTPADSPPPQGQPERIRNRIKT